MLEIAASEQPKIINLSVMEVLSSDSSVQAVSPPDLEKESIGFTVNKVPNKALAENV